MDALSGTPPEQPLPESVSLRLISREGSRMTLEDASGARWYLLSDECYEGRDVRISNIDPKKKRGMNMAGLRRVGNGPVRDGPLKLVAPGEKEHRVIVKELRPLVGGGFAVVAERYTGKVVTHPKENGIGYTMTEETEAFGKFILANAVPKPDATPVKDGRASVVRKLWDRLRGK